MSAADRDRGAARGACSAFADVSLTDGACATWGDGWKGGMMLAPMQHLGAAGLACIEVLSPAVVAHCLARGENPIERVRAFRDRAASTPLRALLSLLPGHASCDRLAGPALAACLRLLARNGIAEVVLLDPLAEAAALRAALHAARDAGLVAIAALPHDADARVERTAAAAAALAAGGAQRVMLRDEAGLLDGERLGALVPALRSALGVTPLDLHTRCHTGLGPQVVLEAVRQGVARIDTALPCVANGASAPSLRLLLRSATLLGMPLVAPRAGALDAAAAALAAAGDEAGLAPGEPWAFDLAPWLHRLPGEVAAEAMRALRARGRGLHAFARECALIRAEFGGVPMLQPFAAAIASQALQHLDGGPRYATLQPGLRRVLQGAWGDFGPLPEALVHKVGRIAGPRVPAAAPESDDALLTLIGGVEPAARATPPALRHEASTPRQALVRGLLARWGEWAELCVSGPGFTIDLECRNAEPPT